MVAFYSRWRRAIIGDFETLGKNLFIMVCLKIIFIALIHPIQWTIALPVGVTDPAKRQKKTSCIEYRQDRSGECIRQVAHRTSSSCLDSVTS